MPIGPAGYFLKINVGYFEIKDLTREVLASEGLEITPTGGQIPPKWDLEEYRWIYSESSGDCYAPF